MKTNAQATFFEASCKVHINSNLVFYRFFFSIPASPCACMQNFQSFRSRKLGQVGLVGRPYAKQTDRMIDRQTDL